MAMTPQEGSMLQDLVRKVQQTQLTEKDPDAEELLLDTLGRDPDAIYKLAQTVLVQNLALNQARAQMQQLQQQTQPQAPAQPARATSFLGSLLGHRDPVPAAPAPAPQYQAPPQYQQVPVYEAPQYAPPAPGYASPSPAGSFMRSAATTAAGVAAGALAFEGIESLMHGGFGHGGGEWGGGGGYGSGVGAPPVEETVINNYYDDPQQQGGNFGEHREHEASYDERPESGDRGGVENASYQPDTDPTSSDDFGSGDDFSSDFGGGDDSNFA
jgi:hypothetical protein